MSLLDGMTQEVKETTADSLGGTKFIVDSGLHKMIIDVAYLSKAASGAIGLNLHLKGEGSFIRQTLWIKSGDKKGNKTYWVDKRTGEKNNLPGFSQANHLTKLLVGMDKNIMDMAASTEEKIIKLYDYNQRSDVDTKVEMITDFINKELIVGMVKRIVDKNVKNAAGEYVPSGETREENEINKLFDSEGLTVAEREGGLTSPVFMEQWAKKWNGVIVDKTTKVAGAAPVASIAPTAASGTPTATSIFE